MVQNGKTAGDALGTTLLTGILFFLGAGISAYAGPITFNFGSGNLSNNAGPSAIQTYMNGVLGAQSDGTVIVSAGAVAQNGSGAYAGEGYVVGQNSGSTTAYTLAVKDGGFIMNNDLNINGAGDFHEFDLTFSKAIDSISFDYEIFPDNTGTPTNLPDMEFLAGGHAIAPFPVNASVPVNMHSVNSGMGGFETHPQLGPASTGLLTLNIAGGTELQFIDWPPEIAISNLSITFHQPTPEPASMVLLGSCLLVSVGLMRRKKRKSP